MHNQKHQQLVLERAKVVRREFSADETPNKADTLKALDGQIGRLAAVFNPRISEKAKAWLAKNA